jgi:acetyl-CoA carboxylase carboxyltransferase component
MTVRERMTAFFDDGTYFEVGAHGTQMGMAAGPDGGDKPAADGVVCGFGKVAGFLYGFEILMHASGEEVFPFPRTDAG